MMALINETMKAPYRGGRDFFFLFLLISPSQKTPYEYFIHSMRRQVIAQREYPFTFHYPPGRGASSGEWVPKPNGWTLNSSKRLYLTFAYPIIDATRRHRQCGKARCVCLCRHTSLTPNGASDAMRWEPCFGHKYCIAPGANPSPVLWRYC